MDYKNAGVDIEAGKSFVDQIKNTVKSTYRPEVMGGFGGFNGMMRIPEGYKKPILVSGADGVGTKLDIAQIWDKHYEVGIDLVAMCVNDVITCGAEPLYFLDYIATGKLEPEKLSSVVKGIAEGCIMSGCTLLGGETAEMPSMYSDMRYDLAGFCTGIVEEDDIIDGSNICRGDLIIGIESSGLHSNGFSLINDMLWRHKIAYLEMPELSTPTRIYASVVKELISEFPILGMAHITGGGIPENLPRCIPNGLEAQVNYDSWPLPDIFKKIMFAGEIPPEEMKRVFNLGIGYCLVVPEEVVSDIHLRIDGHGLQSWTIGAIIDKGK
tara:strand:+ start:105 stop:1079 length:975 start_codon:yes stop_codon:yes gene_type:complete